MSSNIPQTTECKNLDEALHGKGVLFAEDWGRSGAKKYFLAVCCGSQKDGDASRLPHICKIPKFLVEGDHHRYEVLRAEFALRLFFDVEWPVEGFGDEGESRKKLDFLLQRVKEYGSTKDGENHKMFDDPIRLDGSRYGKRSYHVIYPNAVFRKIDVDLKTFVLGFVRWLIEDKKLKGLTYIKKTKRGDQLRCIVDTAVYTRNRCFRMLGQSKASDKTHTKLAAFGSHSEVIPEKTLVQSTVSLKCEYETFIDWLLKARAPADGLYPIYPSPDFGHTARQKGTLCFSMQKKKDKSTTELVVPKKLGKLVIKQDEDILKNLDAEELKQADFAGCFLPVLASLTTAFSDDDDDDEKLKEWIEKLKEWMGGRDKQKINSRLTYARKKGREDKVAVVKCETALAFLKKKHKPVVDMRPNCIRTQPLLQVIEPVESKEWKFVKSGKELKNQLSEMCQGDKISKFQRKHAVYLSGKMGVGKTSAVLYFAKERLAEDVYKDVTYFGPRTVLVKQVSERVEDITLAPTVSKRSDVMVRRYYTGMEEDIMYVQGIRCQEVRLNNNTFHAACINSAAKTPVKPDVVIVDEAVVDVGNMFLCSTQSSRRSRKEGGNDQDQAIAYDRNVIEAVIERIANASVVIYIDAAFTGLLIDAFTRIWSRMKPFSLKNHTGKERKALQRSQGKAKIKDPNVRFYTDDKPTRNFQVQLGVRLAVYNPEQDSGIFTQLHEFISYKHLKTEIIKSIASKKPCIVYTSSSRTATELVNMVKRKGVSPVPMMTLVTAESVKKSKDVGKCINDMNSSFFVAVSNVLSCGVSLEQQDMFDVAYAVFQFSPHTPPLADMIQLCARVRSITSKTLRYTVISKGSEYYAARNTPDVFKLRHEELASSPVCVAFHKLNEAEHTDHINMCRQRGYAAVCVKKALTTAFTHIKDPKEDPVVPMYTSVEPPLVMPSNLPTRGEISRHSNMCHNLPDGTTYQFLTTSKRPITLTRNDLPLEAYGQAISYELADVKRKDGSSPSNAVEPIPFKKRKREAPTDVHDMEEPLFSQAESSIAIDNREAENSSDFELEFESRGDI